jgi:hypothetical protein
MAKGLKTGGRQSGTPNKATAEVRAMAQQYGHRAIERLVTIMEADDQPAAAQVSACKEILDRAYGKSLQTTDLTSSDGSMRPQGYAVIPELAKGMKEWTEAISSLPPEE